MLPAQSHFSPLLLSSLLLLSLPALLLLLLFPAFSPPAASTPLFRRAVLSPQHPRPPKIAFLFLTHTPLPFAPLWDSFFRNHSHLFNIYVHLDPAAHLPHPLPALFATRLIPATPTHRASPSLIAAERRLLAAALLDDPANHFFALLSPSCIPIHSFPFVYRSLLSAPSRPSFIEILSAEPQLWDRYIARGEDVMLPEVPFDQFRIGSQFFVLSRRHARLVVHDRHLWPKFRIPCLPAMQDTCYPEEHYFPTLLNIKDPQGCTGYTLTRVNWTDSIGGHPHTYMPAEVTPQLIQELRRTNDSSYSYLFARKFSKECLQPLMDIADDAIFHDD